MSDDRFFIDPNLAKFKEEYEGLRPSLRFSDTAQLTMALLFGWSDDESRWAMAAVDSSGRVRTTSDEGSVESTNASSVSVSTSNSVALSANADRRQFMMRNTGTADVHFSYSEDDATTSDFVLKNGEVLVETEWSGEVNMITASGTATVEILEYLES